MYTNQNPGRDGLPSYVKFTLPIVANGETFVGTQGSLEIYGMHDRKKKMLGFQFHPESILTQNGLPLVRKALALLLER